MDTRTNVAVFLLLAAAATALLGLPMVLTSHDWWSPSSLHEHVALYLTIEALVAGIAGFGLMHRQRWALKMLTPCALLGALSVFQAGATLIRSNARLGGVMTAVVIAFVIVPMVFMFTTALVYPKRMELE